MMGDNLNKDGKDYDHPRKDWDKAFREMAANGDDRLADWNAPNLTSFDRDEWEWGEDENLDKNKEK